MATTQDGDEISFVKPLKLERAIIPASEKQSVRIFPPTNLSATMNFPSIVHPGGDFPFTIRLDGVTNKPRNTRWRLRKTTWRIEEQSKATVTPCAHHAARAPTGENEDTRIIGSGELKRGWKSDFDGPGDGRIELEVLAGIPAYAEAATRIEDCEELGVEVKHVLIVEMIVAEEYATSLYTRGNTPTGSARVLRMQFHLNVTSRAGLGISWDEEQPPIYECVPSPPPRYLGLPEPPFRYAEFETMSEQ